MSEGRLFAGQVDGAGAFRLFPPAELAFQAAVAEQPAGARLWVLLKTEEDIRSDRANRYWWVACVATVRDLWQKQLGTLIPKEAVHDRLVTIFGGGLVDTPLGPGRTSSRTKTTRAMYLMTEEVREYVWHEYGVAIPSGEDWLRDHGEEEP
jgi:hypothetical protein